MSSSARNETSSDPGSSLFTGPQCMSIHYCIDWYILRLVVVTTVFVFNCSLQTILFSNEPHNSMWSLISLVILTNYYFPLSYINCVHLIFSYLQSVYTNFHLYNASHNSNKVDFFCYFSFTLKPWGKPTAFENSLLWCKQMFKFCSSRISNAHIHEWCKIFPPPLTVFFIVTVVFVGFFCAVMSQREKV